MAVGSQQYAVSSTAVLIAVAPGSSVRAPGAMVWLTGDTTNDVFIGGANVSSTNGLKLVHATSIGPITLFSGDRLFAVAASPSTVSVLQT